MKGGGDHGALKIELFCVEKISKSSVECFLHVDDDVKACLHMKLCFSYFDPRLFHPLQIRQVEKRKKYIYLNSLSYTSWNGKGFKKKRVVFVCFLAT